MDVDVKNRTLPTLTTARLILRPLRIEDGPAIQEGAHHPDVARMTIRIPHLYPDGAAEKWIAEHQRDWEAEKQLTLGICDREEDQVRGVVHVYIDADNNHAELGYWVAVPWQGKGFATEASGALMQYCFDELAFNKVHAHCMATNPASSRVLENIGMKREGVLRQHIRKDSRFVEAVFYGLLREEFTDALRAASQ